MPSDSPACRQRRPGADTSASASPLCCRSSPRSPRWALLARRRTPQSLGSASRSSPTNSVNRCHPPGSATPWSTSQRGLPRMPRAVSGSPRPASPNSPERRVDESNQTPRTCTYICGRSSSPQVRGNVVARARSPMRGFGAASMRPLRRGVCRSRFDDVQLHDCGLAWVAPVGADLRRE